MCNPRETHRRANPRRARALSAAVLSAAALLGGGVDFAFDIPLDLAAEITGFRHDEMGFDDDIAPFTVLEKLFAADEG